MKRISYSRYRRVLQIMKDEPSLKRQLGKKMIAVNAGGENDMKDVPEEVVYVTEAIHKDGLDAYTLSKVEVIDRAHDLLVAQPRPVPLLPDYEPSAVAANGSSNHVDEPAPSKKAEPKAKAKSAPKKKAEPPEPKRQKRPAAPKAEATAERPTAVEPAATGEKVAVEPEPVQALADSKIDDEHIIVVLNQLLRRLRQKEFLLPAMPCPEGKTEQLLKDVPRVTGIAVLNLGYAMITLFEPFMEDAEVKSLCNRLVEWLNEIHRRTILPSAEKESTAG